MISLSFEWNKEPTDFENCNECKQLILSDMHTWSLYSGMQLLRKMRLCEDCYNNQERLPPEYIISEQKIKRYEDEQILNLPVGAMILTVISREQNDVSLFILVDTHEREREDRKIYTSISHRPLKAPITRYIGSVFIFSGKGVLHVYE